MWLFKKHNSAKQGTLHRHLNEIRNYAHEHFTWKRMFHTHGTILGLAGLKLLAAEAFVVKMLAGPVLFAKGLLVAAISALPFVSHASDAGIAEPTQPPVIQAQWASSLEEQKAQKQANHPTAPKTAPIADDQQIHQNTVSDEDTQKADLNEVGLQKTQKTNNGYVETPLVDPNKQEAANGAANQAGVGKTTLYGSD